MRLQSAHRRIFSGAVASVQEGSAVAAIGTDTGGSVRAPAALGGLAGYRATIGRGDWRGGAHLAVTFDTMGWLFRDLEDAPFLAAPYAPIQNQESISFSRFAFLGGKFLHDCEPEVMEGFRRVIGELQALGLEQSVDPEWWKDSVEDLRATAGIGGCTVVVGQLRSLRAGHSPASLGWGASLTPSEGPRCGSVTPITARAWMSSSPRTNWSTAPSGGAPHGRGR